MTGTTPGAIHFATTHSAAGGLRELWDDIAEGLIARGHAAERFVLYPPADAAGEMVDTRTWHHVVPAKPRTPLGFAQMMAAMVRYLRAHRPAAIVSAMPLANVVLPIAAALARTRTRVFVSHHSPTDTHNPALDRLDALTGTLRCVAGIVAVSEAVRATLAHKPARYREKATVIHNALSRRVESMVDALASARAGAPSTSWVTSPERPLRVVALGRLSYQKNHPTLIRAIARVPGATLEIVGSGEDEASLRALIADLASADPTLPDRITLPGLLPRTDALARAAAADVFVQVSRYEGHSLALIEAARLGLPLIVSDVPVQVEGVTTRDGTRCGIVVPLVDAEALAAAITRLRDEPAERAHWSAHARRLGAEASNARMLDQWEALLSPERASG